MGEMIIIVKDKKGKQKKKFKKNRGVKKNETRTSKS
jgi:hypothetical protein